MKLIAVDVDGTLLNSNNEINPKTRDTLIKAGHAGHKIVIVSGRPTSGVKHLAKELNFDEFGGLLSNFNGGAITNYASDEVIVNHSLDRDLALELLNDTKDLDLEIIIPFEDQILSDTDNRYLEFEHKILGLETRAVPDIRQNLDFAPNKIIFAKNEEILDQHIPFLLEKYGDRTSQVRSQRFYYEIMPKGLSKGKSLLEIADYYGIDKKDIIAFGDEINDVSMLEVAGIAVAMDNAVSPIKEIADYVTLSNDQDGIADYLEKFVL